MTVNSNSPNTAREFRAKLPRTVMLVEDSKMDREMYRRYLKSDAKYQYTFVEAETGEEALDSYQQCQPDIILLDYLLPDMDGLRWLSELKQHYFNFCPVIVLTGQGDESIAVQFIKLGAVNYLLKGQITREKLKFLVSKEISLRNLQRERQIYATTVQSQIRKLDEAKKQLQNQVDRNEISQRLIHSSEEKFRLAIDYAPIPIIIHADDGEIIQVSQTWTELSGYSIEDIPTTAVWIEKAYKEQRETVRLAIDRLYDLNRRIDEGQFKIITASGEIRIWDFSSAPLGKLLDGRRLVISTAKDVTASQQAEIALQESENQFRNTFEQAAVGIAHVAPDGKWLKVNQKLCQIVGYTKEELLPKTFQEITHPDDLSQDMRYVRQILANEIPAYSIEKRYIHKNSEPVWVELTVSLVKKSDGEPDYLISVIEDISDRKNLESSLKKSFRRLSNLHKIDKAILAAEKPEAIAQTIVDDIYGFLPCQRISIFTFDWQRETATILATQGIGKMLGNGLQISLNVWQEVIDRLQNSDVSSPRQSPRQDYNTITPSPPSPTTGLLSCNADRENERKQDYIIACLSQLPQLSQIVMAIEPKLDCFVAFPLKSQENLLGVLILWLENPQEIATEELTTIEEISSQVAIALEQARLYKQTQSYALQLEERVAQRTAQKEINQELKAFTYSISHDLKAPLRAIHGFAQALQEDYEDCLDDLGQEYTSRLISCAQQMTQLIEDLLAYSRLSRREIQLKPVKLARIVNQAIEQLKLEIDRTQAEITVVEPLLTMKGNKTVLLQVVSNLLSNAIKFVPPGVRPKVSISTEVIAEDQTSSAPKVRLWIEDNGIGINPEHQERIFRVFERLHGNEAYAGTGIGLAIVKKGMKRLGGELGVESEPDRGSRFWIEGKEK